MNTSAITVAQSNAFVTTFEVPPTGTGALDGLCFAVKDLIDVAGWKTGCGNPSWRDTHPPAVVHAPCVEQLLRAGARCVGKTMTDELAFGLLGENHFYGTPLNPRSPDRVPGGSSSGSASAVACGLVDFALGTDTGGSCRVPANNCGIWGLRPSHGFISVPNSKPHDTHYHGTHCAGTIAGANESGQWIGVAPEAKLAGALVLPKGTGTIAQILAGISFVDLGYTQLTRY